MSLHDKGVRTEKFAEIKGLKSMDWSSIPATTQHKCLSITEVLVRYGSAFRKVDPEQKQVC